MMNFAALSKGFGSRSTTNSNIAAKDCRDFDSPSVSLIVQEFQLTASGGQQILGSSEQVDAGIGTGPLLVRRVACLELAKAVLAHHPLAQVSHANVQPASASWASLNIIDGL